MPEKTSWIIGGSSTCDLVLEDETVSGRHCRLRRDKRGFEVEDLNSTNGTFVNGQRVVGTCRIHVGDRVTLGQTVPMPWPELTPDRVIAIGRAADNDVVIDSPGISGYHARLTVFDHQLLLEDLGSTNGTAIGSADNTIRRSTVSRGDTVYLGSTAVPVARLISTTTATVPVRRPARTSVSNRASGSRNGGSAWFLLGSGISIGVGLLLALFVFMFWPRSSSPTPPGLTPQVVDESANRGADQHPSVEPGPKPELGLPQRVERALFTVVASRPDGSMAYCLGTAWVVDSHTLITSGAAAWTLQREVAQNQQLTDHFVYSPASQQQFSIIETRIHPQFKAARQLVHSARQKRAALLKSAPSGNSADIEQQIREKLLQFHRDEFDALQRQAHSNGAILRVAEKLPPALQLAPPQTSLRPQRPVRIYGLPIDGKYPVFDRAEPSSMNIVKGRIHHVVGLAPDEPHNRRLLLECDVDHLLNDYTGSPVLTEQGEVIGLYSGPTQLAAGTSANQPKTVDVVLIEHLRELLTTQK